MPVFCVFDVCAVTACSHVNLSPGNRHQHQRALVRTNVDWLNQPSSSDPCRVILRLIYNSISTKHKTYHISAFPSLHFVSVTFSSFPLFKTFVKFFFYINICFLLPAGPNPDQEDRREPRHRQMWLHVQHPPQTRCCTVRAADTHWRLMRHLRRLFLKEHWH